MTQFDALSQDEARARVKQMAELFGIREFQFYDAFEGYSRPPSGKDVWHHALFGRKIRRDVIQAYTDEISKYRGRSWLYVQAMGADPGDRQFEEGAEVVGQHVVMQKPLLDVVVPDASWARHVAPQWAEFANALGFSGIHWDTLGAYNSRMTQRQDFPGFLREALPILKKEGLDQTANFVDGAFWDASLKGDKDGEGKVIAFPYWEVWTVPRVVNDFFREAVPEGGGVYVHYPGKTADHEGERQNEMNRGVWPFDLLIWRWQKAHATGNTHLAVGDGLRHIQSEYFPDTVDIAGPDMVKLRSTVFNNTVFGPEDHPAKILWA